MITAGIDPSLRSFGWAIINSSLPQNQRRVSSGHGGTSSIQVPIARFIHFREMVRDLLSKHKVDAVGIESPAYSGGPFTETHFGLMMFAMEAIFEQRKDCVLFDPTTLKYLIGKSNASKSDMQRFVQKNTMSPVPIQNDEADAYCVAYFTDRFLKIKNNLLKPGDLSEPEKRTFLTRTRKSKNLSGKEVIKRTAHIFRQNSRYFEFSKVPPGDVNLPNKSPVSDSLLKWLEANSL